MQNVKTFKTSKFQKVKNEKTSKRSKYQNGKVFKMSTCHIFELSKVKPNLNRRLCILNILPL